MDVTSRRGTGSRSILRNPRHDRFPLRAIHALCLLAVSVPLAAAPPRTPDDPGRPARPDLQGPREEAPDLPDPDLRAPQVLNGRGRVHHGTARTHVVVRFRDDVPDWRRDEIARGGGGRGYRQARFADFGRVEVAPGQSVDALLASLRATPGVEWAEKDPILSGTIGDVRPITGADHLNDPFFPDQWNLDRIRYHESLRLNPTRGRGAVVAVIDSGVASGTGSVYPARRGIDLEGVSFLPGIDFVDGGPPLDLGVAVTNEPLSRALRFGHGTFVAAQIAAQVNNGVAIAGIAPEVTILPVRVLGIDNATTASVVAEAIRFSVGAGADVINMSLGGRESFGPLSAAIEEAARAGVVLVAAAGNEGADPDAPPEPTFPARHPMVIAVGATAFDGSRASYSNAGPGLDLMAPAGEDPNIRRGTTRDAALSTSFVHDPDTGGTLYGGFFATGTSFAAPQVAAAAALLAALGVDDPEAIRFVLEETARDLASPGPDAQTGRGLLDLLRAHQGLGFTN